MGTYSDGSKDTTFEHTECRGCVVIDIADICDVDGTHFVSTYT